MQSLLQEGGLRAPPHHLIAASPHPREHRGRAFQPLGEYISTGVITEFYTTGLAGG